MKNFVKIKSIDVFPYLDELMDCGLAWSEKRAKITESQRETLCIPLRSEFFEAGKRLCDCHRSYKTENYKKFPLITNFIEDFAMEKNAELSRAMIVSLKPRGKVYRHWDFGEYYAIRDRYHFVLDSEGSDMYIGDEHAIFHPGELWWYNNKIEHESVNNSDKERIHVIFDLLPRSPI